MAVRRNLDEARIAIAVGDEDIAVRIPGHIGFAVECRPSGRPVWPARLGGVRIVQDFEVGLEIIDRFRRAAQPEDMLALPDCT